MGSSYFQLLVIDQCRLTHSYSYIKDKLCTRHNYCGLSHVVNEYVPTSTVSYLNILRNSLLMNKDKLCTNTQLLWGVTCCQRNVSPRLQLFVETI